MKNVTIAHFNSFNQRRYSTPWVCAMDERGKYDFSQEVGTYTGNGRYGEAGDLVIFEPEVGRVYSYGQKDHRGNGTTNKHIKFVSEDTWVECDKLGKEV